MIQITTNQTYVVSKDGYAKPNSPNRSQKMQYNHYDCSSLDSKKYKTVCYSFKSFQYHCKQTYNFKLFAL